VCSDFLWPLSHISKIFLFFLFGQLLAELGLAGWIGILAFTYSQYCWKSTTVITCATVRRLAAVAACVCVAVSIAVGVPAGNPQDKGKQCALCSEAADAAVYAFFGFGLLAVGILAFLNSGLARSQQSTKEPEVSFFSRHHMAINVLLLLAHAVCGIATWIYTRPGAGGVDDSKLLAVFIAWLCLVFCKFLAHFLASRSPLAHHSHTNPVSAVVSDNQIDEVIHKVAKMEPVNPGGSAAAAPASDRRSSVGGRRHFSMSPPPNSLFPPQKPAIPLSRANVGSQTFLNFDETFRTPSQESTIALKKKSMPASGSLRGKPVPQRKEDTNPAAVTTLKQSRPQSRGTMGSMKYVMVTPKKYKNVCVFFLFLIPVIFLLSFHQEPVLATTLPAEFQRQQDAQVTRDGTLHFRIC
jgi:hypothetical protein